MMLTKKLKVLLALVLAGVAAVCQADPVPQIDDMVSAATNGSEAKVLELKSRIELLPKPARGDRKKARSLNEQGLKELNAGNFAEAATAFKKAGSADPLDAEILSNEGYALIKANDPEAAIDPIERSITLQPGRASAWGTLGEALARSGFLEQATAAFNIAFTFSQNREKTKEFLAKLSAEESTPVLAQSAKAALASEGIKIPREVKESTHGQVNKGAIGNAENKVSIDGEPEVKMPIASTIKRAESPTEISSTTLQNSGKIPSSITNNSEKINNSDASSTHPSPSKAPVIEKQKTDLFRYGLSQIPAAIAALSLLLIVAALINPSLVNIFRTEPKRIKVAAGWVGIYTLSEICIDLGPTYLIVLFSVYFIAIKRKQILIPITNFINKNKERFHNLNKEKRIEIIIACFIAFFGSIAIIVSATNPGLIGHGSARKMYEKFKRINNETPGEFETNFIRGEVLASCNSHYKYPSQYGWIEFQNIVIMGQHVKNPETIRLYVFIIDYGDKLEGIWRGEDNISTLLNMAESKGCKIKLDK